MRASVHARLGAVFHPGPSGDATFVAGPRFPFKPARRGGDVGTRFDEPLSAWLNRLHAGRTHAELLGESPIDDVADPIGSGRDSYERTATEIAELLDHVIELAFRRQAA